MAGFAHMRYENKLKLYIRGNAQKYKNQRKFAQAHFCAFSEIVIQQ